MRVRPRWGWGFEDAAISTADARAAAPGLTQLLGFGATEPEEPVPFERVTLPEPRLAVPPQLAGICADDTEARARHARGQSYLDTVRGLRGEYDHVPDVVARPREEGEIEDVLEWAAAANAAIVPWGGGTSVVGGVEPRVPDRFDGAVTVDLGALDALREVDDVSRAARIGAGANGPRIEEHLSGHGLTMRFFPQSFELSTLGGWIATRAGGHFAICRDHGGVHDEEGAGSAGGAIGSWRAAFLRMPYLRDMLVRLGVFTDTFESAVTWERFPAFHASVTGAVEAALGEPCRVTCRLTHVYPDGPAPYFTVLAPARRGDEVAQWHEMKRAAGRSILDAGGTITHHHGVGRDHRPWYDAQRPDAFAAALRAAKHALDPAGLLNPGVLI